MHIKNTNPPKSDAFSPFSSSLEKTFQLKTATKTIANINIKNNPNFLLHPITTFPFNLFYSSIHPQSPLPSRSLFSSSLLHSNSLTYSLYSHSTLPQILYLQINIYHFPPDHLLVYVVSEWSGGCFFDRY